MATVATEKVKRARRILGVSAMARALGCSRDHLARCLRGERKMSRELRQRYEGRLVAPH